MTTLLKSISADDTTIMFSEDASFPLSFGVILIGAELIFYTSNYMGTLYGCARGLAGGDGAGTHEAGATISLASYFHDIISASGAFTDLAVQGDITMGSGQIILAGNTDPALPGLCTGTAGYGLDTSNGTDVAIAADSVWVAQFDHTDTATETAMLLYDVDTDLIQRVTVGANDSGGTGFRLLRIANA